MGNAAAKPARPAGQNQAQPQKKKSSGIWGFLKFVGKCILHAIEFVGGLIATATGVGAAVGVPMMVHAGYSMVQTARAEIKREEREANNNATRRQVEIDARAAAAANERAEAAEAENAELNRQLEEAHVEHEQDRAARERDRVERERLQAQLNTLNERVDRHDAVLQQHAAPHDAQPNQAEEELNQNRAAPANGNANNRNNMFAANPANIANHFAALRQQQANVQPNRVANVAPVAPPAAANGRR